MPVRFGRYGGHVVPSRLARSYQPVNDAQRLARRGVRRREVPIGVGRLLRRPRLARAARGERNNNGARALLQQTCRTAGPRALHKPLEPPFVPVALLLARGPAQARLHAVAGRGTIRLLRILRRRHGSAGARRHLPRARCQQRRPCDEHAGARALFGLARRAGGGPPNPLRPAAQEPAAGAQPRHGGVPNAHNRELHAARERHLGHPLADRRAPPTPLPHPQQRAERDDPGAVRATWRAPAPSTRPCAST